MLSLHHQHKRKRIYQKKEPYPSPKFYKRILDRTVFAAAIVSPIMTIPQIYIVWTQRSAKGLSLAAWSTYLIVAVVWLVYGMVHKDRAIIVNSFLFVVVHSMVVLGILIFWWLTELRFWRELFCFLIRPQLLCRHEPNLAHLDLLVYSTDLFWRLVLAFLG